MTRDPSEAGTLLRMSERALRLYALDSRECLLIHVVLDWSFRRGSMEALIPELRYFTRCTGVEETDVRKILTRLVDRGILQVKELGRDLRARKLRSYRFRPEAAWWQDAPLRVDVDDAIEAERELEAMWQLGRDTEPSGQVRLLPTMDDDFDDGLSAASREAVLKDAAAFAGAQSEVAAGRRPDAQKEVPAARAGGSGSVGDLPSERAMGKIPIPLVMGDLPTGLSDAGARAPDDLTIRKSVTANDLQDRAKSVRCVANGKNVRGFADARKQAAWLRVESMCACPAWEPFRFWWVAKVRDLPVDLIATALADTEFYFQNNRCNEQPGAVLWRRIVIVAGDMGINHPALKKREAIS